MSDVGYFMLKIEIHVDSSAKYGMPVSSDVGCQPRTRCQMWAMEFIDVPPMKLPHSSLYTVW